ncbi:ABC transporter ATP-binding protein (plasmid) [Halorarum halophilum]|uniref:ABC transporter ATP-binding protein n=1 Tax=Halorarum halophilum TaxID=2743090 RepID=A0A7D5GI32_9EURY|nr:ABC transporter ATP-binding protein [Halobaculum halophilum]QLG29690.1 ABC transporter ATP-binding protein [Halobaculum halophilum]
MAAIEVADLTKEYGDVRGVDSLSFAVEEGEIFGFLGPNGAGKTTTIRTLLGFQSPTAGTATVLGADARDEAALVEAKRRIGYLPASPAFDGTATGREILDLHASIKGDERSAELLDLFDPPVDRPVREYSTGNEQKLGIVQAFMHDPDLVVLDEPTSGLDPLMQRRFEEFVRAERDRGVTVFFSSHVLGEVRRVCDRVGVLRDGRLVTTERVADLLGRSGKVVRVRAAEALTAANFDFAGAHDVDVHGSDGDAVAEASLTYTGDVNALLERLARFDLVDLAVEEAPLEDVFMRFYGEGVDGSGTGTDGESARPAAASTGGGGSDV